MLCFLNLLTLFHLAAWITWPTLVNVTAVVDIEAQQQSISPEIASDAGRPIAGVSRAIIVTSASISLLSL